MSFVDTGKRAPEKKKQPEKEKTLKELFTGSTLDGSIERRKVKGLDEFPHDPSVAVIRRALSKALLAYNPDADPELIDWAGYAETNLTIEENAEIFRKAYPQYVWTSQEEENPLTQELTRILKEAEQEGFSARQLSASVNAAKIKIGLGQTKEAKETIEKLRQQVKQLQAEKPRVEFAQTSEIRAIGKPVESRPPPPAPTSAKPQERYAQVLANRILTETNLLTVLGVQASASDEEVRNARNQLLVLFHPDVFANTELGTRVSQKLNAAYEALRTKAQRLTYQQTQRPAPQTVEVQVGRPTLYCQKCGPQQGLVLMQYVRTYGPYKSGRSYELYKCPLCPETKTVNFEYGQFLGVG